MSNQNSTHKVPFGQKLAFGLGMLANQLFPAALGIFMVVLVENLGFPGWMLGIIYFVPKLFDAITDPIMGFITDNTKSKWGRRRQYVIIGAIMTGVSFAFMWQLSSDPNVTYKKTKKDNITFLQSSKNCSDSLYRVTFSDLGPNNGDYILKTDKFTKNQSHEFVPSISGVKQGNFKPTNEVLQPSISKNVINNFIYFILVSLLFYLGITIFSVPYVAMGYEMSDDFHERTSIMATSQFIGQFAWILAPWLWVIMNPEYGFYVSGEVATRELAIYVAIVCTILAIIPGLFIKSKSTLNENYEPLTLANARGSFDLIIEGFKEALKIVPFKKLCIATFFIFNAFNTTAAFSYFIIKYYIYNGEGFGLWPTLYGCIGAVFTTILIIPIISVMAKKMGKKNAFIWSQGISILGYFSLIFLFVPGKPYLFFFALPLVSFGIGGLFTLMMSMTSDVIDIDELNTGKRREGIFGAIYWWMVKFGAAIAGGLSGLILTIINFDSGAATQTAETMFELRLFFSAIPMIGTLIAIWVMKDYDVSEEKAREVSAELAKRKKKPTSSYLPGKLVSLLQNNDLNSINGVDYSQKSEAEIEKAFASIFNNGLHGLCFSPYLEGQKAGDILSHEQIRKRLDIIAPHTKWIRSFSCTEGNELIPEIAHKKGIKTIVGAWISNDRARNEIEINALIKLANEGLVDIAAVGNEVLHREEISEKELIEYIKRVKKAIPSHIQVSYVDAYYQFIERPKLIDNCDVILCNFYPFWEGAANDFSLSYLNNMLEVTKIISNGKKIIITETGWPSFGEIVESAIPSRINAMKYFIISQEWAKNNNLEIFHFSSFDESWKVIQEGKLGTSWGLWDKNEKFKYKK